MKRIIVGILSILVFLCFEPASVNAQTLSEDDLSGVIAGLLRALDFAYDEEIGHNLDSSVTWKESFTKGSLVLHLTFKNYRFYVEKEDSRQKKLLSLEGEVDMDQDTGALSGTLSVTGAASVRSVAFSGFELDEYDGTGTVQVNNAAYNGNAFRDLVDDVLFTYVYEDRVIDFAIEGGFVFASALVAMNETNIFEKLEEAGYDSSSAAIPAGIQGSNTEGTVKIVSGNNSFELTYTNFTSETLTLTGWPLAPALTGKIAMGSTMGDSTEVLEINGTLTVKNLSMVSSMNFDSCIMEDDIEDSTGSVTINGKGIPFVDLLMLSFTRLF
jgi:hypothetical protein